MTSMYSVYVLLVLLIITLTSLFYNGNYIVGYIGVANLALLITIVIVFKLIVLDYMAASTKALKVQGYSEFNLVYTGVKSLHEVDLP